MLADKSRQLEAASRHKSEFIANMSPELRTPLNAMILERAQAHRAGVSAAEKQTLFAGMPRRVYRLG